MKYSRIILIFSFLLSVYTTQSVFGQRIKGITFVAPPKEVGVAAMERIRQTHAEWIALVPYGFQKMGETKITFNVSRQWWGERHEGMITCIKNAKQTGLKVMIKPQLWLQGNWIGDLDYKTLEEWKAWEESYKAYIMEYVEMANDHGVEMICIGTEIRNSVKRRPTFWKNMIADIRSVYRGKLVYSANWDDYQDVKFWQELDFVGLSAYYPLTDANVPMVKDLLSQWLPIKNNLVNYAKKFKKEILFTEYGYLTVEGCAGKTWELEKNRHSKIPNEVAQANAFEGLYSAWWNEKNWAGGFIWKWFPEGMGHEGSVITDYTPQNKMSEKIIKNWYQKIP